MTKPHNLLIVRTDRIGDVVLSLPLASEIKKHYPDCKITFLLRTYTKPLLEDNPYIDKISEIKIRDSKPSLKQNISNLWKENFDTVIVVYPTFKISLIIFLSGIKNRIGTGYRWYSFLFNKKVFEHRKNAEKHELEYNLSMLEHLGIRYDPLRRDYDFSLHARESKKKEISELLKSRGISGYKKLVIMHPGSGGSSVDLPPEKFNELIRLISVNEDVSIILTGSSPEKELCGSISAGTNALNLAGILDLSGLIALIDLSHLFISNSTGPLHIAAALGKYVIGFYPKVRACSAQRWGPYSEKGIVFTPELECADCTVEQCERLNCMNYIDINKVFEKTQKILKLLPNTGETDA